MGNLLIASLNVSLQQLIKLNCTKLWRKEIANICCLHDAELL